MADEFEGINLGIEETGESDESTHEETSASSGTEGQESHERETDTSTEQRTEGTGTTQQDNQQQQPGQGASPAQTPNQQGQQPAQRVVRSDAQGNLIDQNGQVVARAGAERRLYEKATDATTRLEQATGQLQMYANKVNELQQQVNQSQALNGMPQKLGLNENEAVMSMQLMNKWKQDPVGTIKYLLTEAKAAGHNVDIEGLAPGMDMGAIARIIDQRLQPLQQDREAQQREQQVQQEAERQYQEFIYNPAFPNARTHENEIAQLLRSDPRLSLEAAYYKLQSYALQRGLDFTQPLGPQLQYQQQQPAQQSVANGGGAPMVPGGGNAPVQTPSPTYADPDDSYDAIIRQVMGGSS